jgi:hypothetical protein
MLAGGTDIAGQQPAGACVHDYTYGTDYLCCTTGTYPLLARHPEANLGYPHKVGQSRIGQVP